MFRGFDSLAGFEQHLPDRTHLESVRVLVGTPCSMRSNAAYMLRKFHITVIPPLYIENLRWTNCYSPGFCSSLKKLF